MWNRLSDSLNDFRVMDWNCHSEESFYYCAHWCNGYKAELIKHSFSLHWISFWKYANKSLNVGQNVLLVLQRKLSSHPQQQPRPGLIAHLRLNSQLDAQSTCLQPKFGRTKNLFLWSYLWHASKPEATKNSLSLRKACVTPVWPCCLPSPPSLL